MHENFFFMHILFVFTIKQLSSIGEDEVLIILNLEFHNKYTLVLVLKNFNIF
jgi:hypothetical protein